MSSLGCSASLSMSFVLLPASALTHVAKSKVPKSGHPLVSCQTWPGQITSQGTPLLFTRAHAQAKLVCEDRTRGIAETACAQNARRPTQANILNGFGCFAETKRPKP